MLLISSMEPVEDAAALWEAQAQWEPAMGMG